MLWVVGTDWEADLGDWPIATIQVVGGEHLGHPTFDAFAAAVSTVLDRGERCAIVLDATGARPSAQTRRAVATLMQERRSEIERHVGAGALVLPNAFYRGILTAVRWLNPRPLQVPWDVFANRADARRWVHARFEGPRQSPPPI